MNQYGRLELAEYERLVGRGRGGPRRRWALAVLIAVAFGAGWIAPGLVQKRTNEWSYRRAMVAARSADLNERQLGVGAILRLTEQGLGTLVETAHRTGASGRDASIFLGHLAERMVSEIRALENKKEPHFKRHGDSLERIRQILKR